MRVNVVCWLIPEEIQMVTWSRCSHKTSFIKTTPYRHCRIKLSFLGEKKKTMLLFLITITMEIITTMTTNAEGSGVLPDTTCG